MSNPAWPTPTKRHMLQVAALADDLDRAAGAVGTRVTEVAPGMAMISDAAIPEAMLRLLDLVYEANLIVDFAWWEWSDEARRLTHRPAEVARADLVTLQKLLTVHFRSDRFSQGHLDAVHANGHLAVVLRRLGEIGRAMPEEA